MELSPLCTPNTVYNLSYLKKGMKTYFLYYSCANLSAHSLIPIVSKPNTPRHKLPPPNSNIFREVNVVKQLKRSLLVRVLSVFIGAC